MRPRSCSGSSRSSRSTSSRTRTIRSAIRSSSRSSASSRPSPRSSTSSASERTGGVMAELTLAATAPFGADVLERLAQTNDVTLLLTRPDKPRGRGRTLQPTPAKAVADRLGIPVAQPAKLDASVEIPADVVVVCAYGLLIPEGLLERGLWLNVHPSLLPRWRGAAPVERTLMAGDARTGVTIHETIKELDAGPIAAQEAFELTDDDDAGTVFVRSAAIAARLLDEVMASPQFTPQPDDGVTYAEKITAADRELDPSRPA